VCRPCVIEFREDASHAGRRLTDEPAQLGRRSAGLGWRGAEDAEGRPFGVVQAETVEVAFVDPSDLARLLEALVADAADTGRQSRTAP
jgi:hypothetical protein